MDDESPASSVDVITGRVVLKAGDLLLQMSDLAVLLLHHGVYLTKFGHSSQRLGHVLHVGLVALGEMIFQAQKVRLVGLDLVWRHLVIGGDGEVQGWLDDEVWLLFVFKLGPMYRR